MGGTFAPINSQYLVAHDSTLAYQSPVIDLRKPVSSLGYQMKWEQTVRGKFTWQASIFPNPYRWEQYVGQNKVELDASNKPPQSGIVAIPGVWLTVGFLRFIWEPEPSSSGTIDVAIRVVPV